MATGNGPPVMHMAKVTRAGAVMHAVLCANRVAWNPRLTSDASLVTCKKCLLIIESRK